MKSSSSNGLGGRPHGLSASRAWAVLAVLGIAVPIAAYFWLIQHYAVNVIQADQWSDVQLIGRSHSGALSLGSLWAQHNENRIFFPNLIAVLLGRTTHLNVVFEEYLSAVMLIAATGMFVLAHKRRSPTTPWIYYVPVVVLLFSFVQYGDTLVGFQLSWYLVLLAFAASLFILDRPSLSWVLLAGAAVVAIVGSFSSFQGLFIWPIGVVILFQRRRPGSFICAWIGAAFVTAIVYLYHFDSNDVGQAPTDHLYALHHPTESVNFFFFTIGEILNFHFHPHTTNAAVTMFGVVVVLIALTVLIAYGFRRDGTSGTPIGTALILFGFLFAAFTTYGRVSAGIWDATFSRYTTYDLLIVVGTYVALLDRFKVRARSRRIERIVIPLAGAVLVGVIGLQVGFGISNGLAGARVNHQVETIGADVAVNVARAPAGTVQLSLRPGWSDGQIRRVVRTARKYHLSLFASSSTIAYYERVGIFAPADLWSLEQTAP
jgi:hypothetical protein